MIQKFMDIKQKNFNSIMVQLKPANNNGKSKHLCKFQFHNGTIKTVFLPTFPPLSLKISIP